AAVLVTFVVASPTPGIANSCNTGSLQCCNQTFDSKSGQANLLASLLSINLSQITGQVGTLISVIGAGQGGSCTQPVCCENSSSNGFIVVGCSPVNL
ncbi:hypothetical protein K443DRAFT_113085, partial [Laccaria amethystina LaAM-08-1]